ncbi:unnamed protein product [Didymodactylos carnosus]|nr:unnamed protein product [Didymodactylos carnosus]CAF3809479.1 unnamed protein product [Didymodactylos carnosus]
MDWLDSAGEIMEVATQSGLYKQFSHLKTDYDRIQFMHDHKQLLTTTIEKYLKELTNNGKDITKAISYRKQGNDCFVSKNLRQAAWQVDKSEMKILLNENFLGVTALVLVFRRAACYHKLGDKVRSSYELKIAAELIKHANGLDRKKIESYCKEMEQLSRQTEETLSKKLDDDHEQESGILQSNNEEKERQYKNLDELIDNCQSPSDTIALKLLSSKTNSKNELPSPLTPPSPPRKLEELEIYRPQLYNKKHEQIPCCSSSVRMNYTKEKGRHLIAQKPIPSNEIILIEKPYSWLLLPNYCYTYCDHCLKLIVIPFVCSKCSHVIYCSEYCQNYSLTNYHQYECDYIHVLRTLGIAYLAYRTITITGLERLLAPTNKTSSSCYYSDYESVKKLITHTEQMSIDDLFHYSLTAYLLSEIIKQTKFIQGTSHEEQIKQQLIIASHLLRHIQQMICNAQTISVMKKNIKPKQQENNEVSASSHIVINEQQQQQSTKKTKSATQNEGNQNGMNGITKAKVKDISNDENQTDDIDDDLYFDNFSENEDDSFISERRLASALFPTCSLMNHSCVPNITCSFYNALLIVRTSRNILAGEELYNCYGPQKSRMSTQLRQSVLYEQYYFKCTCEGCVENTKMNDRKLKSTKKLLPSSSTTTTTRFPSIKKNKVDNSNEQVTGNAHNLFYLNFAEKLNEAKTKFSNGTNCLILYEQQTNNADLWQKGLIYLEEAQLLYEHIINELNLDSVHIYDYIAKIYNDKQDYEKCSSYLNRSISILTTYVHSYSIGYLLDDLRKYAQTLFNSRKFNDSLSMCAQALTLIQKHSITSMNGQNIKDYLKNIEDLKAECELCIKLLQN